MFEVAGPVDGRRREAEAYYANKPTVTEIQPAGRSRHQALPVTPCSTQ